jgi:predicted NUDIX family phosphoesterase
LTEKEEQVLCFESKLLARYLTQKIFSPPFIWDQIRANIVKIPKSQAEQNEEYKQLIAYGIIRSENSILMYRRTTKGDENRLWNQYSIGVGGHINIYDQKQKQMTKVGKNNIPINFFQAAVQREIEEEITIDSPYYLGTPELKYFINDNSDAVGRVHFGLVWLFEMKYPKTTLPPIEVKRKIVRGKKGLGEINFYDINYLKLHKEHFENWSQLIIEAICTEQTCK